jgi:hypothetical protein
MAAMVPTDATALTVGCIACSCFTDLARRTFRTVLCFATFLRADILCEEMKEVKTVNVEDVSATGAHD